MARHARHLLMLMMALAVCEVQGQPQGVPGFAASPNGDTLRYLMFGAADTASAPHPLVVFLHGAGERGSDNTSQLKHCVPYLLADSVRENYNFALLVPQCPAAYRWVETDWTLPSHTMPAEPSVPMRMLLRLIDSLSLTDGIDSRRIYLIGISMGGFGVWDALQRRPDLFAAAVPICGGGDPAFAQQLAQIPLRIFHGGKDKLVIPARSKQMYAAIRPLKGDAYATDCQLTIYNDLGHFCWNRALETPDFFRWLFYHKKDEKEN